MDMKERKIDKKPLSTPVNIERGTNVRGIRMNIYVFILSRVNDIVKLF